MGTKNTSWVHDRLHVLFGTKPRLLKFEDEFFDGVFFTDEEELLKILEESLGGKQVANQVFSEQEKQNLVNYMGEFIFANSCDAYFSALELADWDESRITWEGSKKCSCVYIPLKSIAAGITTGKEKVNYSSLILVDRPVPIVNGTKVDSSLGGLFSNCDDLLLVDVSGRNAPSPSCYHEVVHYLVRHYLDDVNLRDCMYGETEADQREELLTHFFTDNHMMTRALYDFLGGIKLLRDSDRSLSSVQMKRIAFSYGDYSDGTSDSYTKGTDTSKVKCCRTKRMSVLRERNKSKSLTRSKNPVTKDSIEQAQSLYLRVNGRDKIRLRSLFTKLEDKYGKQR